MVARGVRLGPGPFSVGLQPVSDGVRRDCPGRLPGPGDLRPGFNLSATKRWVIASGVCRGRAGRVRSGVQAGSDGAGVAGVVVCCRGRGWRGWRACAFTTTAAATVEAAMAVAVVLSVRRAGPSSVQDRAGPGPDPDPDPEPDRSRFGCAGRGGVCRSGGFAERRGRCSPPLGVAILGVCRCGRVHVRCHLLPILRAACCVLLLNCHLPTADCVLLTAVSGRSRCVLPMSVSVWCVCLVRGTASGWGDPFRAISRSTVPSPSFWLSRPGSESR